MVSTLLKAIEDCRDELNTLYDTEGTINQNIIEKSQELDLLINKHYAMKNNTSDVSQVSSEHLEKHTKYFVF